MNKFVLAAALSTGSTIALASVVTFPAFIPSSSSGSTTVRSSAPVYPTAKNSANAFLSAPDVVEEWVPVRWHNTDRGNGLQAGNAMPSSDYSLQEANNPAPSPDNSSASWTKPSSTVVIDLTSNMHAARAGGVLALANLAPGIGEPEQVAFNSVGDPPRFSALAGIRSNTQPPTVSPVPEPESYIMMLAALGAITFMKRRGR